MFLSASFQPRDLKLCDVNKKYLGASIPLMITKKKQHTFSHEQAAFTDTTRAIYDKFVELRAFGESQSLQTSLTEKLKEI